MLAYFLLLSVPAFFVLGDFRTNNFAMLLVFVVYLLFVGFRYHVGMDWNNYEHIHQYMVSLTIDELMWRSEPLSYLLFWLSRDLTGGTLLTNFVAGLILVVGVFSFAWRTSDPWLSIIAATPYLVIAVGMSGVRQAMAMGIILLTLSLWYRVSMVTRIVLIFVAGGFHLSALSMLILVTLGLHIRPAYRAVLTGATVVAAGFILVRTDFADDRIPFYVESYVTGEEVVHSPGALLHLLLLVIPILLYWARRPYTVLRGHPTATSSRGGSASAPAGAVGRGRSRPWRFLSARRVRPTGPQLATGHLLFDSPPVGRSLLQTASRTVTPRRSVRPSGVRATDRRFSIDSHVLNPQLTFYGIFGVIALLAFYNFSSTGASRLSIYLQFIPMTLYPAVASSFKSENRGLMRVLLILLHFTILAAWLVFANNSAAHIPYRNLLLEAP
jgi:hypothetical protein